MAEVINATTGAFVDAYRYILDSIPPNLQALPKLVIFSIVIILYSIFVWVFYRFVAKRDIIKLNLNKYNKFKYGWLLKIFVAFFYILEFIIILPFLTSFWFAVFATLLIILAKEQTLSAILLISSGIIAAIRVTSYYREDLARDLAKMFPFTLLGVVILTPGFFDIQSSLSKISEIPFLLNDIIHYALFIILIEIVLRLFYLIISFATSGGREEEEEEEG